jgi:two-component system nitrate/nitrite response regulator NarL
MTEERPMDPIRVMVVDDHRLFRRALVALLALDRGVSVVGQAGDAGEAVRQAQALQPELILLDVDLPGASGIQALGSLREVCPSVRILMLTVSEDEGDLQAALRGGANGYLLKTMESDDLSRAIQRAARGEAVVSPEMTTKLVAALQQPAATPAGDMSAPLSPREQEVLQQIARGASNKEIARTLSIAETTVKIHVQHILRKLGLTSRVQAAVFATARP